MTLSTGSAEKEKMKKIFTYTKNAKLSPEILKHLESLDYLCIEVSSLKDIKVLENFTGFEAGWLLKTALEIIEDNHSAKQEFAQRIINKTLGKEDV